MPSTRSSTSIAGLAQVVHERVQVADRLDRRSRGRSPGRLLVAQQAEHRAGLRQRLAAGLRDDLERVLGRVDVGADDVPADARLHRDQRHAVRDDVVQLPGDPQALLDDRPVGLLAAAAASCSAARSRSRLLGTPRADRVTQGPGDQQQGEGLQQVGGRAGPGRRAARER